MLLTTKLIKPAALLTGTCQLLRLPLAGEIQQLGAQLAEQRTVKHYTV